MKRSICRLATVLVAVVSLGSARAAEKEKSEDVRHVDGKGAVALVAKERADKDPAFVVLDIRTPEEFAEGHIDGARNVDFKADDFEKKVAKLDRKTTYLVHCRSGRRSTASLEVFKKLGFENVIHLDGGILDWTKAGGKVVEPKE